MKRFTDILFGVIYVGAGVLFGLLSLVFLVPMYFFFILCEQASFVTEGCFAYAGAFLGYQSNTNNDTEGNNDEQ
jgi:hypothetical protein